MPTPPILCNHSGAVRRAFNRHFPDNPQIQGNRTTVPPPGELHPIVKDAQFKWTMVDERAGTISGAGTFFAGDLPGVFTESIKVEAAVFSDGGIIQSEDFASA